MGKRYSGKVAAVVIFSTRRAKSLNKAENDPGIERKAYNKPAQKSCTQRRENDVGESVWRCSEESGVKDSRDKLITRLTENTDNQHWQRLQRVHTRLYPHFHGGERPAHYKVVMCVVAVGLFAPCL